MSDLNHDHFLLCCSLWYDLHFHSNAVSQT